MTSTILLYGSTILWFPILFFKRELAFDPRTAAQLLPRLLSRGFRASGGRKPFWQPELCPHLPRQAPPPDLNEQYSVCLQQRRNPLKTAQGADIMKPERYGEIR